MGLGEDSGSGGWAVRSAHRPPVLHQLERYRVLGRLGAGGMAEVFLARDEQDHARRAVIKRLHPSLADDDELVTMFLDEARLFMRLAHPNICRFYDAAWVDEQPCVAMEYVDGVTLEALIEEAVRYGGIPTSIALSIAADVAAALDSVHRLRDELGRPLEVVHRDVSPKNIMIGYDGRVRLLDFGLAKSTVNRSVTQPGIAKGKLSYIAPEVYEGRPAGRAADLFALGVCLVEALTGRPLYRFARPKDVRDAIVDGPVPSLRQREPGAPAVLEELVQRALAKEPLARFGSAGELEEALRQALVHLGEAPTQAEVAELVTSVFREERASGPSLEPTRFGAAWRRSEPPAGRDPSGPVATEPVDVARGAAPSVPSPAPAKRLGIAAALGGAALLAIVGAAAWAFGAPAPQATPSLAPDREPATVEAPPRPAAAPVASPVAPPASAVSAAAPLEAAASPRPPAVTEAAPIRIAPVRFEAAEDLLARGSLDVNSQPWSEVYVDGERVGYTPIAGLEVAAGRRTLRFVDGEGVSVERVVDVPADGRARLFVRLGEAGPPAEAEPPPAEGGPPPVGPSEALAELAP